MYLHTFWYRFKLPDEDELMSNPDLGITDNFKVIIKASKCDVFADAEPLPQFGNYEVGDKIYMSGGNYNSVFVCIASDSFWGLWWKPIQAPATPWQTVPDTAILSTSYQQHPTYPFQIMIDNKGRLFGRGAIQVKSTSTITNGTSISIMRPMPDGLSPAADTMIPCAIDPVDMANPATLAALKSGRWVIRDDGTSSHRFYNASSSGPKTTDIWHSEVKYTPGRNDFTTP